MKYHLGLDVGGTNLVAGVVDDNYRIVARCSCPVGDKRSLEDVTAMMATVSRRAVERSGVSMGSIAG